MIVTEFTNKTVFISGAGSGIGAATAKLFAQQGANLVLVGRRLENLRETAQAAKAYGTNVEVASLDVNNFTAVKDLIRALPNLDIAVNNAGIEGSVGDTLELAPDDFDIVMNTNVKALWHCMQEQIRWWRAHRKAGAMVNISSIAGIRGFTESSLYVASKHAVIGLSQAIALEQIKHQIRINIVSPGAVDTAMLRRIFPSGLDSVSESQPVKRTGNPKEIAEAIVWLSSEKASFVVGHNFVVDGGKTIAG
jgi:NAD(P)-dependent dehydrogenase (short-subunit alcohol dehydrogenase family)